MKVFEHEHPLKLIDLQQEYADREEEEEERDQDGDHLITRDEFRCACDRCGQEINMHHRYYYNCKEGSSSCKFSLHKFCGEVSTRLVHTSHPHPLFLGNNQLRKINWTCSICQSQHKPVDIYYKCSSCDFFIDVNCAIEVGKKIIYHPCHPHLLMCAIYKPILCLCNACGKKHEGFFYQCTTCGSFTIHKDCAFLPQKLLIQQTTNDDCYHTHPLTISYSFPRKDQEAKHNPKCRVCGDGFYDTEHLWIYECDKCMYYSHLACATSGRKPSLNRAALPAGFEKDFGNFKDVDYPHHLLHLPFPDETYTIQKHLLFEEIGSGTLTTDEVNLKHISHHQHPLVLVDTQCNDSAVRMKKTQLLLCNGCHRPIMSTVPFYKCVERCDFALHEWCTRLPSELFFELVLLSNFPRCFFNVFYCVVCSLPCNGFAYYDATGEEYFDVACAFILCKLKPRKITHKAHPNHILSLNFIRSLDGACHICLLPFRSEDPFSKRDAHNQIVYSCRDCHVRIHAECALLLPETIRHKYDKHPMQLSYLPIENHKSEYFCEICEEDLNPHVAFYHCHDCAQSVHTACAPLKLQSETHTYTRYPRSTHPFMNIKFGGIHNTDGHPHPLSFAQGTVLDGQCSMCGEGLQYKLIFKCLRCKFAIDYGCCESLNKL